MAEGSGSQNLPCCHKETEMEPWNRQVAKNPGIGHYQQDCLYQCLVPIPWLDAMNSLDFLQNEEKFDEFPKTNFTNQLAEST